MAAAREFGLRDAGRLDDNMVSMPHPQAMEAMLAGGDITAHLGSPPFQYQELQHAQARRLLSSYDILGGKATFNMLWTRDDFYEENPKTFAAVLSALREAIEMITQDPLRAVQAYMLQAQSALTEEELLAMLRDPDIEFTTTPRRIMEFAGFMHDSGMLNKRPSSWKELFFPPLHLENGS